jgi:hypothetical protein
MRILWLSPRYTEVGWWMAQIIFHGLERVSPELMQPINACTGCLLCQELCGLQADGCRPWEISVAAAEEFTQREGPNAAHRLYGSISKHDIPWPETAVGGGAWSDDLNDPLLPSQDALVFAAEAL